MAFKGLYVEKIMCM